MQEVLSLVDCLVEFVFRVLYLRFDLVVASQPWCK